MVNFETPWHNNGGLNGISIDHPSGMAESRFTQGFYLRFIAFQTCGRLNERKFYEWFHDHDANTDVFARSATHATMSQVRQPTRRC